jgi:RNA polymerase sigma-70 factor (ECF subfamily)
MATLTQLPDAQLVSLALGTEAKAFEILYRRHVAFAIHLATRIEGSSRDVEDIVHDAFIKAFSRLRDLSDPAAFRSWLGSIVVFAVRSRLRRTRLMNLLGLGRGSEPVDLDSLASPDASPHTRAQLAQVYALLRTRPTDERIAWTLRCVEGHELEVVARLTTCSLATVKRRISRTQAFLDEHFVTEAPEAARASSEPSRTDEGRSTAPEGRPIEGRHLRSESRDAGARDSSPTQTPIDDSAAHTPDPNHAIQSHRKSRP